MAPAPRKLIISASRRQDMPACAPARLLAQIAAREFRWRQPYSAEPLRLAFEPEEIFCLALWSKDFGRLLEPDAAEQIDPLHPYFLFTINDCPSLERGLETSLANRLSQAETIARRYGPERLLWRFDPIVHWEDERGRRHDNTAGFRAIAERLAALGVRRCVLSFAQLYGKVLKRQRRLGLVFVDPPLGDKLAVIDRLNEVAEPLGIGLEACCQPAIVEAHPKLRAARCIDGDYLAQVVDADPEGLDRAPHRNRKSCGCTRSVDVGSYEPCRHRCAYCYANPSLD